MLQESLERSEMKKSRCTATGWQTICKAIEREVNSVPLGFLHHQGSSNPLLRVLCPNLLKNATFTDRAPRGLFSIPNSAQDMMTKIEDTYNMWFQIWNCEYLPLVMDRPKWQEEEQNLKEQDLVYFKLTDSKLAADWRLGIVEYVNTGRDGKVRSVGVSYKIMVEDGGKIYNEDFEWKNSVVERPARAVVKLMNIEDTSILEDMNKVQDLVKEILNDNEKSRRDPDNQEIQNVLDSQKNLDTMEADGHTADDAMNIEKTSDKMESKSKTKKVVKFRTNLKEDDDGLKNTPGDRKKKKVLTNGYKTPSFLKKVDEDMVYAQWDPATSISDEKEVGLSSAGHSEEVVEMMTRRVEVLGSEETDV